MNRIKTQAGRSLVPAALMVVFLVAASATLAAQASCDPRAYGAKGDGAMKDTAAIQKAIDVCADKGGGTVELSAGTYVSAPLVLKSNINLHLAKGATLLGSPDHADYPPQTEFHEPDRQPLLGATNASNVSITGEGTVDGNGASWWLEARSIKDHGILGNHPRPKLIIFDHCKGVRVEGVTVQNSPMWQIVPYYSDNVVIRGVRITAPVGSPNTDAIDPFSSSNVLIDHVYSDTGDDNVAIKSGPINSPGPDDPSRDIVVQDCTFMHGHGMSIGSELSGGAQNIVAQRITFEGTDNGIRVKANRDRGHDVGNLVFKDLTMKNVKNPIIISEYYPKVMPPDDEAPQAVGRLTPYFHDIVIENVTATGGEVAAVIAGLPESPVKGVVLKNVKISAEKGMSIGYAEVTGEGVVVTASTGEGIIKLKGADAKLK
jgi:polygalacturonase